MHIVIQGQSATLRYVTPHATEHIENCGRVCYRSEDRKRVLDSDHFVRARVKQGHESILEHASASVEFTSSIAILRELMRHRLASFSQESTRYCDYSDTMAFIWPHLLQDMPTVAGELGRRTAFAQYVLHLDGGERHGAHAYALGCWDAAERYHQLRQLGFAVEYARDVLPLGLASKCVMTANLRTWRHVFSLRVLGDAGRPHPAIISLLDPVLHELAHSAPGVFDDLIARATKEPEDGGDE